MRPRLFAPSAFVFLIACGDGSSAEPSPGSPVTISGYLGSPGETVVFTAVDLDTGAVTALGSATSSTSATTAGSKTGYAFDRTFILGRNFWAPQFSASLAASPGRLALTASAPLVDVGAGAGAVSPRSIRASGRLCTPASTPSSSDVAVTGEACTEPTSLVLFDDNGVGTPAEHGGWTVLKQGSATVSGVSVEWEVGSYPVQGLTVYGLVCYPSAVGKHPVLIANHGLDLQNIQAGLDEASLGFCEAMASGGWLTAMSTYRGESLQLEEIADTFANGTATSDGGVELCLGEVTDVLRLTTLVLERTTVDPSRVLMWGHSHGACISARAIEQGAPVQAAVLVATPTNFATFYDACAGTDSTCAYEAGIVADLTGYTPNTLQGGIAYGWRSPVSFVEDLAWRTDVKLLMLQGGADLIVHPGQACQLADPLATSMLDFHVSGPAPTDLPCPSIAWQTASPPDGSSPGSWPANRYLIVYDTLDHGTILSDPTAWASFASFAESLGWETTVPGPIAYF